MTTVTISLPESLKKFLDKQVLSQGFGNVSEYFRSLLRQAQKQAEEKELEDLLLKGIQSETTEVNADFWKQLKQDAVNLLKKQVKA